MRVHGSPWEVEIMIETKTLSESPWEVEYRMDTVDRVGVVHESP